MTVYVLWFMLEYLFTCHLTSVLMFKSLLMISSVASPCSTDMYNNLVLIVIVISFHKTSPFSMSTATLTFRDAAVFLMCTCSQISADTSYWTCTGSSHWLFSLSHSSLALGIQWNPPQMQLLQAEHHNAIVIDDQVPHCAPGSVCEHTQFLTHVHSLA